MASNGTQIPPITAFPPLPPLDNTLGAWLLGTFFGLLLLGAEYLQTFIYFRSYPRDRLYLKIWVLLLTISETITSALTIHACYFYFVTSFGNPAAIAVPIWSEKILPIPGTISTVITQTFVARRVWILQKRFRPVAVFAGLLVFAHAGAYWALTVLGWGAQSQDEFLVYSWLGTLAGGLVMGGDLMMTAVLIYFLHSHRTATVAQTASLLDNLIMYTISSGLIICVFNILLLVTSLLWPQTLIFAAISIILTKLYSNSFLASLNSRQSLINRGVIMDFAKTPTTSLTFKTTVPSISTMVRRDTTRRGGHTTQTQTFDATPIELQFLDDGDVSPISPIKSKVKVETSIV